MIPRLSEKIVQAQIVHLLRSIGATVYVLGTVRPRGDRHHGTCQTPGLPDLYVFMPTRGVNRCQRIWIEVKAQGGRLRPEQRAFADLCEAHSQPHIVGGLDDVIAWLTARGYLRREQVPHYRQPEMREG